MANLTDLEFNKFDGRGRLQTRDLGKIVSEEYNYVSFGYNATGDLTTAVYKSGGAGGTVVATLTLGYADGQLDSIVKT